MFSISSRLSEDLTPNEYSYVILCNFLLGCETAQWWWHDERPRIDQQWRKHCLPEACQVWDWMYVHLPNVSCLGIWQGHYLQRLSGCWRVKENDSSETLKTIRQLPQTSTLVQSLHWSFAREERCWNIFLCVSVLQVRYQLNTEIPQVKWMLQ